MMLLVIVLSIQLISAGDIDDHRVTASSLGLYSEWKGLSHGQPFTAEEFLSFLKILSDSEVDSSLRDRIASGLSLTRRATARVGAHWCCKIPQQNLTVSRDVVRARVVQKTVTSGGSVRCGSYGWRRCQAPKEYVVSVTQYYTDTIQDEIPAPDWTNGCPDKHLTCCEGYAYYEKLQNCLKFNELESILKVVRDYQKELSILSDFNSSNSTK